MVQYSEGSFVNRRKQRIFTASYLPDVGQPVTGALFFLHGLGEYCGRYQHVFTTLATQANIAVYCHDYHGHGKSEPKEEKGRCYFEEYEHVIDDTNQYLDEVLPKHQGVPWFVGGQSLGGLNSVIVGHKRQKDFTGMIIISAAIDVEWTPVLRCQAVVGDCISGCCPFGKIVPAVRPKDMNADPKLVEQFLNDPLIYQGNVKARTGNEILKKFKEESKVQSQITIPILAFHGTKDKCTSLPAVKRLVNNVACKDKALIEMEGGYHEMLMGPEKDDIISKMAAWIKAHTPDSGAAPAVDDDGIHLEIEKPNGK